MTDSEYNDEVRAYVDGEQSVSTVIVQSVAAALDRAPSEIGPLDAVIEPDALEALFSPPPTGSRREEARVAFTYEECDVTVHADGEIVVRPPECQ